MAILLTAMLRRTGSFNASASRIDDNEGVGNSGAGTETGRSIVKQKMGSIICNHPEYPEDEKGVCPFL